EFEEKVDKLVQTRDAHTAASSRQNIRPPPSLLLHRTSGSHQNFMPIRNAHRKPGAKAAREGEAESKAQLISRPLAQVADVVPEANAKVDDQDLQQGVEKIQEHISTISAHPRRATKCPGQPLSLDASRPRAPEQSMRDATSGE
ncbi:MAG: hypothetical protein Q9196_007054, partial [Gyalolechia fulgens]